MNAIKIVGLIIFAIVLIVVGPLITIWAMNTLFPALAIPYTFWTWLATIIVCGAVKTNVNVRK